MKRKTTEKYLYLTHLYRITIFLTNECLNCFFEGGRGGREDEFTISVVKEL